MRNNWLKLAERDPESVSTDQIYFCEDHFDVYKASMVSMLAGADFIKTSTGMEEVNATLPVGLVMCRAIRKFYQMTGVKVGLKPAGGIKTAQDAVNWLILVYTELGPEWLTPKLFRIGAFSLLDKLIEKIVV